MKSKTIYSLIIGSLGIITLFILNLEARKDNNISTNQKKLFVNTNHSQIHSSNESVIFEASLEKVLKSIEQIQKKMEKQDKKISG